MYDSYKEHLFNELYFCLIDVQNIKKPFRLYCKTIILIYIWKMIVKLIWMAYTKGRSLI